MVSYVLFGDGVGGCLVSSEKTDQALQVQDITYAYLGLDEKIGQLLDWKGTRGELTQEPMVQEEYKLIEKLVPTLALNSFKDFMIEAGQPSIEELWVMPPQLSGKMVEGICQKLEVPKEKVLTSVAEIGNCANAALFFQLKEFFKVAQKGDEGVALSIESSRWLTSRIHLVKGERLDA